MNILAHIPATELQEGDVYVDCGCIFRAENVEHNRPCLTSLSGLDTRTEWDAVWTAAGQDPGPGYRRFGSAGNALRTVALLSRTLPAAGTAGEASTA